MERQLIIKSLFDLLKEGGKCEKIQGWAHVNFSVLVLQGERCFRGCLEIRLGELRDR